MFEKFKSLTYPEKYGYVYDSENWHSNHAPICPEFMFFETMGDGFTAHTPNHPIQLAMFTDYLASLAVTMLAKPLLAEKLANRFNDTPNVDALAFCATVVYKESDQYQKRRYWSLEERKLTSTASKEFDKRYKRVETWNDGTGAAIYAMVLPDYSNGFMKYLYATFIEDWCRKQDKLSVWMPSPLEFLKWDNLVTDKYLTSYAWDTCKTITESVTKARWAERSVESIKEQIERNNAPEVQDGPAEMHLSANDPMDPANRKEVA